MKTDLTPIVIRTSEEVIAHVLSLPPRYTDDERLAIMMHQHCSPPITFWCTRVGPNPDRPEFADDD